MPEASRIAFASLSRVEAYRRLGVTEEATTREEIWESASN
jgi:hypothetical protein